MGWVTSRVCSRYPGMLGMSLISTDASMFLFFRRKTTILKKILPSTLRSEMFLNCFSMVEVSFLGIQTCSTCLHVPPNHSQYLPEDSEQLWAALVCHVRNAGQPMSYFFHQSFVKQHQPVNLIMWIKKHLPHSLYMSSSGATAGPSWSHNEKI